MRVEILLIGLITFGCQTSGPKRIESTSSIFSQGSIDEFSFTQAESEAIHKQMVELDEIHGVLHDTQSFHSINGRLICQQSGAIRSCSIRTTLDSPEILSKKARVNSELSGRLTQFFLRHRADLKNQPLTIANVRCDYKGPKLPPFEVVDIKCHLDQPRLPQESVFEDFVAEKLFIALKGERPTGTKVLAKGDVWCESDLCKVRVRDSGAHSTAVRLSSFDINARELESETSMELISKLENVQSEAVIVTNEGKAHDNNTPIAENFKGPIHCESTLLAIKSGTMRRYYCRVTLQP